MDPPSPPRLRDVDVSDDISDGDWSFLNGEVSSDVHSVNDHCGSDDMINSCYGWREWYARADRLGLHPTTYCDDRAEVAHELLNDPDFDSHNCTEISGVPWRDRNMNIGHNLAARDRSHVYKDFRSPRKARRRERNEREKYYNYRHVKRGQLGKQHHIPDCYSPDHVCQDNLLADTEQITMQKHDLYREAQKYPRPPQYHQSHAWDRRYNERRLQEMRDIKQYDLDPLHYDDDALGVVEGSWWCCSYCCIGTGVWDLLYGADGYRRWEYDGTSAHYLGTLENVPIEWATDAEVEEEEVELRWIDWFGDYGEYVHEEDVLDESDGDVGVEAIFEFEDGEFPPLRREGEPVLRPARVVTPTATVCSEGHLGLFREEDYVVVDAHGGVEVERPEEDSEHEDYVMI